MKKKYEVIGIVGEGAYGIVYKCKNKETDKFVAIKKFKETEDELVQKTMKRELKMLQQLKHENIVEFQESFTSKGNLFLVFEYCEKNLLEVLEESPDGLSPKLIKSFIYQMCKAIAYMHKNNMIHRDIKPENLLIDENLNLKLCDFGFARKVKLNKNNNNINEMTDYVATRWYRSPELLLSGGIYGPDVDYWAVGCIMGELADGNPMFPGENETDQINCIINVLGNLPEELVNMFYKNPIYEGKELKHVSKVESLERRYMGKLGPTAIDFMKGLLQLDPKKRLNSETVFKHKYFACYMKDEKEREKINEIIGVKENKENNNINNNKENNIKANSVSSTKNEKNNVILVNKNSIDKNKSNESMIDSNNNNKNINSNTNRNENVNSIPKQPTETKVINNTTNINIINYNNINDPPNNIIEIHNNHINNNINNSINNNNNSNSISKTKNIKSIKNNPNSNNILINNSMIIKVSNNSNPKDNKIELNNTTSQNSIKLKSFINPNFSNNIKKNINMNNSVYNFPVGNKKSLSVNKFIKLNEYPNMSLLNNFPNLMTISLSQGKNNKVHKINNNINSINNISSTFYSLKNNPNSNNNIMTKKLSSFNNNSNNSLEKKKNNKYNYMSLANNYLGGYKTFFNKNNSNDKYNYDINTNYFKDEVKKYNSSPIGNYYNNVIDENEEYPNANDSNINIKSFYNNKTNKKKNYFNDKKDVKLMTKYKDSKYFGKNNNGGKYGFKKNMNGYGTLYNYGYGKKNNNVELPQLIQIYNKNTVSKNNNHFYGFPYNKKY